MDANDARTHHLRYLIAAAGGPAEWTKKYGGTRWTQPQVSQWISDSKPKGIGKRLARDLEEAMNLPLGALDRIEAKDDTLNTTLVSRDEIPPGYVRFPLLRGFIGAGGGGYVPDYPEVVRYIDVAEEWAERNIRAPRHAVRVITARGDSMTGDISDGDVLFVDERVQAFDTDSIYVLNWQGRPLVKRLQAKRDGSVVIRSTNPAYEPEIVPADEIDQLYISGRVLAAWSFRKF